MKSSLLLCTMNIVIGNGCGKFEFVKGKSYRKSTLESDYRLSRGQIRNFFLPANSSRS